MPRGQHHDEPAKRHHCDANRHGNTGTRARCSGRNAKSQFMHPYAEFGDDKPKTQYCDAGADPSEERPFIGEIIGGVLFRGALLWSHSISGVHCTMRCLT